MSIKSYAVHLLITGGKRAHRNSKRRPGGGCRLRRRQGDLRCCKRHDRELLESVDQHDTDITCREADKPGWRRWRALTAGSNTKSGAGLGRRGCRHTQGAVGTANLAQVEHAHAVSGCNIDVLTCACRQWIERPLKEKRTDACETRCVRTCCERETRHRVISRDTETACSGLLPCVEKNHSTSLRERWRSS